MRRIQERAAGALRLTEQHAPRIRVHRAQPARRRRGVARDARQGRRHVVVRVGVVAGAARVLQVVVVHRVEQVDVPVRQEVRVQREAEQAVVAPVSDLVRDVDHGRRALHAVLDDPHAARALPHVHAAVRIERDADRGVPRAADGRFRESDRRVGTRGTRDREPRKNTQKQRQQRSAHSPGPRRYEIVHGAAKQMNAQHAAPGGARPGSREPAAVRV